jgi:aryl-alcohol dehydrogenase-like predicted oxidoreductase
MTIGSDPLSAREVSVLSLGAMRFGTTTDEATSFAILDKYVAAGGNFIDTSNNYLFFVNGTQGGESEELLGRWRASRGIGDEIVIATKAGARPIAPATGFDTPLEGLSRAAIREASERSRERLGVERLDLYYAHVPTSPPCGRSPAPGRGTPHDRPAGPGDRGLPGGPPFPRLPDEPP